MDNPMHGLFSQLRGGQASSPALIWYGADGERVELSGRVLENWIAKTANLLVEELDAVPGSVLRLRLPVHWKTLVLTLGAWAAGCRVQEVPAGGPEAAGQPFPAGGAPDAAGSGAVFATAAAERGPLADAVGVPVAVALGALQMRWDQEPVPGAVDYAAEVRSFADSFDDFGQPAAEGAALATPAGELSWTELGKRAARHQAEAALPTVLAEAGAGLLRTLQAGLDAWYAGGVLVLAGEGREPDAALLAAERVTTRVGA